MKIRLYRSMGVLAHEHTPVYTMDAPASDYYDVVAVSLPDGWSVGSNAAGESLIYGPSGEVWLANQVVSNEGDSPALRWYDGSEDRVILLVEEAGGNGC